MKKLTLLALFIVSGMLLNSDTLQEKRSKVIEVLSEKYSNLSNEEFSKIVLNGIEIGKEVVSSKEANIQDYNNLGNLYFINREYEMALEMYKKVIENEENRTLQLNAITISMGIYGIKEEYENYFKYFSTLTSKIKESELDENTKQNIYDACINYGEKLRKENKIEESIKYNKKAIELNKDSNVAYNNLAMDYYSIGKYEEGKGFIEKAILINPNASFQYETLAEYYLYTGNKDMFYSKLEEAVIKGEKIWEYIYTEPFYKEISKEKRMNDLIQKYNKN